MPSIYGRVFENLFPELMFVQRTFWQAMMYSPTVYFAKSSILLLYLQFFSIKRPMRVAIYTGMVAVGVCYWANMFIDLSCLIPHAGEDWQDIVFNGRPEKLLPWSVVQGTLNVAIDLYTFFLPFPVLTKLNVTSRRRIELSLVFSTALL